MEGFIVTDWDNVGALYTKQGIAPTEEEATRIAIEAGNDMIMSTPRLPAMTPSNSMSILNSTSGAI